MSFSTALWTGVSGLVAAQRQLEVAAHNIANVNTEGYSRQRVELTPSRPSGGTFGVRGNGQVGTGVTIADIVRMRNSLTDAAYRGEAGNNAAAQARADVLGRAESVLGPLDGGVPGALSEFWAAWDNLSLNGNDTAGRQAVLDAGASLTDQLRSGASQLARLRSDTGLQIGDTVDEINRLAKQAAELNQAVMDAVGGQQSPNDLKDQRDQVVDKLAALTGGIVRDGKLGSADVYVSNRALVRGGTYETMQANVGSPAGASWAMDNVAINTGGRLGALSELVNTTLPGLSGELDAFAVGLRDLINTQHAAGFDQDGNPGGAFFSGTSAVDIGVDPGMTGRKVAASASGAAVDGANALQVASLRTSAAVGTDTLQEAIQGFAGHVGGLAASAKTSAASALTVLNSVSGERAETSSVSINEELADIVRFQHAYEASAKVIQVVDQCLDQLINVVGR